MTERGDPAAEEDDASRSCSQELRPSIQEGIYNREAADEAGKHAIKVVWISCMMKEHMRLSGE